MFKIIIGLFIGMLLMGLLYNVGILSLTSSTAKAEGSSLADTLPDITEIYHEALVRPLQEAGGEIQDSDIAQFYQKLLREYGLDEPSSGITQDEHLGLAGMLPDIENINYTALALPLQEAGRNIQDKEIAEFYYRFLEATGWTSKSN